MAAEFIGPIVEWAKTLLESDEMSAALEDAGLEPFASVRKSWTGIVLTWPEAAVMPRTTGFDREGSARHSDNGITIKFSIHGGDSDQLTDRAIAYMKTIDRVISAATYPESVTQVFIAEHDYGVLYEKGAGFNRFPEMHIQVEVYE